MGEGGGGGGGGDVQVVQDSWTTIVSYYTHTCKHKVVKVSNAHTTI